MTTSQDSVYGPQQYSYDANGNRNNEGSAVGPANRLTQDSQFDYSYDEEGNLVSKTNRQTVQVDRYENDHNNRMVQTRTESSAGVLRQTVGKGLIPCAFMVRKWSFGRMGSTPPEK